MSDTGEIFGCLRAVKRQRKADRLEEFHESSLVKSMTEHTLFHWSTTLQGHRLEYWPTTHKWRWQGQNYWGDLKNFINFLQKRGWNGDEIHPC